MITPFLNLGKQPIANGFRKPDDISDEFFYDLQVGFDHETKLVSIINPPDKSKLFTKDYIYRSSGSKTMRQHFEKIAKFLKGGSDIYQSHVIEIGSNDGVMIKHLNPKHTTCVEPCSNMAEVTSALGYHTYPEFWTKDLALKIREEKGLARHVYAANCMCHIPDIQAAFEAVSLVLDDWGCFIFEDPSLESMVLNNSYDQIYDEHAHIFSVEAIKKLLNNVGLYIDTIEPLNTHGGSNRYYAKKYKGPEIQHNEFHIEGLMQWASTVHNSASTLQEQIVRCKNIYGKVAAIGATSKSTIVFNYCNLGPKYIDFITDTTPEKQGLISPGVHIPIVHPDSLELNKIEVAFLGAWNFAKEIKMNHPNIKLLTHVPFPRVL